MRVSDMNHHLRPDEFFRSAISSAQSADALDQTLETLLSSGLGVLPNGSLYHIRVEVARLRGLRIRIYPRDHDPPHFHVVAPGINAKFAINNCSHLGGDLTHQQAKLVKWWFSNGGHLKLIQVWRQTRPSEGTP
jgi:hypothetical protein